MWNFMQKACLTVSSTNYVIWIERDPTKCDYRKVGDNSVNLTETIIALNSVQKLVHFLYKIVVHKRPMIDNII